ncbi:hypothetical protein [Microvirga zambiensis]|uniref:hypothetical protein n=1 Tax=Microvirga zambiensis TaxID=1402137 RepID=UPI0019202DF9|nr:hypothetical protein [Microvirga zambiensis]
MRLWLRRAYGGLRRYLVYHGIAYAVLYVVYRYANSIVTMLLLQIVTLERGDMDWSLVTDLDERWKFLGFDELGLLAEQDPSLELDAGFLSAAFDRGDRCYGFVENGILGAYAWYATRPTPVSEQLTAHVQRDYIYMYKTFTAMAFRGRRLCGTGVAQAFRALTGEGSCRGLVSYIEIHNQPSLKALKRIGFRTIGKALVLGRDLPRLSYSSPGGRNLFRIAIDSSKMSD